MGATAAKRGVPRGRIVPAHLVRAKNLRGAASRRRHDRVACLAPGIPRPYRPRPERVRISYAPRRVPGGKGIGAADSSSGARETPEVAPVGPLDLPQRTRTDSGRRGGSQRAARLFPDAQQGFVAPPQSIPASPDWRSRIQPGGHGLPMRGPAESLLLLGASTDNDSPSNSAPRKAPAMSARDVIEALDSPSSSSLILQRQLRAPRPATQTPERRRQPSGKLPRRHTGSRRLLSKGGRLGVLAARQPPGVRVQCASCAAAVHPRWLRL